MPTSNRLNPPQPKDPRYSLDKLYLMPRLTRAKYQELYQEQAPVFDPTRRIQRWFFTDIPSEDPANELVQFTIWDDAQKKMKPFTCSVEQASTPNLPGNLVYPKYVNSETTSAKLFGPLGESGEGYAPMNGTYLTDPATTKAIMDEINKALGMSLTLEYASDPWPWKYVWGSETRRNINLVEGDIRMSAAFVLIDRFEKGVGSPGKWIKADTGEPQWVPDNPPTGEADLRPEIPMVCRPLLLNERVDCTPFGCAVVRTDLTTNETGPGTGGLTVAQDGRLKTIESDVKSILEKMA